MRTTHLGAIRRCVLSYANRARVYLLLVQATAVNRRGAQCGCRPVYIGRCRIATELCDKHAREAGLQPRLR